MQTTLQGRNQPADIFRG